jgi:N-acetylneuraminic acid mutarotase
LYRKPERIAKMNTQRILKVVVMAGLLSVASTSYAAEGTWTRKADMPTARLAFSTSVVDGKIYAIGGLQNLYGATLPTVEEYDPATDTWTKKADMPAAWSAHSAAVVNGKIYIIGGGPFTNTYAPTVQEYDPATDTWTNKADMPTSRAFLSACAVNGKIYAIGGHLSPGIDFETVEEYDPATDTWTQKADMPTARACFSTSVANGKIYAIGGGWRDFLSTVEEYDPATDTWTTKADMLTAKKLVSTSAVNGKIYAIGGGTALGERVFSTVEEYDPATDTWTKKADMPTARWFHSTSAVNGKIYAIGGDRIGSRTSATSTVEEYTPPLVVDFNGDGVVDCADMCIMVDYWGTDEPFCDIGPTPLGDGIVDVQDLIVLAEYLLTYPGAVAYWKLDETEGDIAYDSVAVNDAVVFGDAVWQPEGGHVAGALQFDGIDDYVSTSFILDPADGPFSVFAWVKGGLPGQVIISQTDGTGTGATWLSADPTDGKLMTKLMPPAIGLRFPPQALTSEFVITDGNWHSIGFVWDGSYRCLYVDRAEVAKDTKPFSMLESSDGGLYSGAGKNLEHGSFFSGLIDDVRIYDRAITP